MTATQTAPLGFPQNLFALFRRAGALFAKSALTILIVIMAGFMAVATAAAGLMLALLAILMNIFGSGDKRQAQPVGARSETVTLDARKTPRGWTVE